MDHYVIHRIGIGPRSPLLVPLPLHHPHLAELLLPCNTDHHRASRWQHASQQEPLVIRFSPLAETHPRQPPVRHSLSRCFHYSYLRILLQRLH